MSQEEKISNITRCSECGSTDLIRDYEVGEIVCERCGYVSYYDLKQRKYICRICGDKAIISPVTMSYAFKLLLQELMSLCVAPKLKLKEMA